jgi:hypothetical protein
MAQVLDKETAAKIRADLKLSAEGLISDQIIALARAIETLVTAIASTR